MIRLFAILFLTFALAATSVSQAVARGQQAGLTDMVICTNGQVVSVRIDANGNIADPAHHCPDCLVAFAAPIPASHPVQPAALPRALVTAVPVPVDAPPAALLAASPRGPPVLS